MAPIKIVSNLKTQFYEFRYLKNENSILKEEIMRLKKWQALAIHNIADNFTMDIRQTIVTSLEAMR